MLGIYILSIWGNYKERFAIYATILVFSNVISIPSLLILRPLIGRYALPAFQSLSFSFLALCMWYTLRDMPLRPKHKVPAALLKRACLDMFYCLAGSGAAFIYSLVDRYFASSLPAGNVSAISYAQLIYDQPVSFVAPIMSIYLVRASAEVKESKKNGDEQLFTTMFMSWSYFFPIGVIIAILSEPIIKLLLGYGAFDAKAISATAPCLMMLVVALPVKLWNSIVARYGQALGKQRLFAIWSYIGLVGNYFLDAAFVKPFGATGLCAATTIMLCASTMFFIIMLAPATVIKLIKDVALQIVIAVVWSIPLYFISSHGTFLPLVVGILIFILHVLLCEKFGIFDKIPQQWRPMQLISAFPSKFKQIKR
jgi:putative peptidoglycan lipid II flippase